MRPAKRIRVVIVVNIYLRKAKVGQFDIAVLAYQDIVWLEVSIQDILGVQVFNCNDDLTNILTSYCFSKPFFPFKNVSKVAVFAILKKQKDVLVILKSEVHFCDKWAVFAEQKNVALCLGIDFHVLRIDHLFVHHFHRE
jgi:hypothetical protein